MTSPLSKTANRASLISGKLQLAVVRKPSVDQLREIVQEINDLRREVVEHGQKLSRR
jgi:hypothetical protein